MNLRQATVTSQPFGSRGGSSGRRADGLDQRFLHGVLGRREVGSATDEDPDHLRHQLPEECVVHSVAVGCSP